MGTSRMIVKIKVLIVLMTVIHQQLSSLAQEVDQFYSAEGVRGGSAHLPCNITPPVSGDKLHILIWFKGRTPIYTFDARDRNIEQAKQWFDEAILGNRGHFRHQEIPARLTLDSVREEDAASYYCRVDFEQSPTRNFAVNLTVIVPPEKITVLNEKGTSSTHYILGPYNEGSSVNITCVSIGGRPLPKVTWWQENALLDDSFEYLTEQRVRNVLHLDRLERRHLHSVFTCQAANNNLQAPISTSVTLDMNLRLLWVHLLDENRPLSANRVYEISCEAVGSRPPPQITWWKGSMQLMNTRETTSPDSNTTTSVLTYIPSVNDSGKYLSCKGQQLLIHSSSMEDGWILNIHHVPLVTLELGRNLNASSIKEGSDVYFECNIKSNPWVYKVSWKHNGKMLYNNPSNGTIVSNQSLVLQSVTRARAGFYTCVGSNHEGDGESNSIYLDIKYVPFCRSGQQKVYNVAKHESVEVRCEVDSNPTKVHFAWKFNNSDNLALAINIPQNLIVAEKTKSTILYTPLKETDYGTLLCKGRNDVGTQGDPCIFYIVPAGKPDPPSNCTVTNQTFDGLQVECLEGFDGGLRQLFITEVYDMREKRLISNATSRFPLFFIRELGQGQDVELVVYAANKKGRSDPVTLQSQTVKVEKEKRAAAVATGFAHLIPILSALISVVATLIIVAVVIVVVIRLRGTDDFDLNKETNDNRNTSPNGSGYMTVDSKNTSSEPLRTELNVSTNSLEEKNPDIIPLSSEEQEEERAFDRLNNSTPGAQVFTRNPAYIDDRSHYNAVLISQQVPSHVLFSKEPPVCLQAYNSLQRVPRLVHHPHLSSYAPRPFREPPNQYEESITSSTPLIPREALTLRPPPKEFATHSHTVTRF